jgi:hypothetical protein
MVAKVWHNSNLASMAPMSSRNESALLISALAGAFFGFVARVHDSRLRADDPTAP